MVFKGFKIILIGTESSGKTTLAADLADYYGLDFAPEFARGYLQQLREPYTYADVLNIAKGQKAIEKEGLKIFDTDLLVVKVWIQEKYKLKVDWIEKEISNYGNRLYLLCDYNIPYEYDKLREHPDLIDRERLYYKYKQLLRELNFSFLEVAGDPDERLKKSIHFIDSMVKM